MTIDRHAHRAVPAATMRVAVLLLALALMAAPSLSAIFGVRSAYGADAQSIINDAQEAGRKAAEGQKQVEALRKEIENLDEQATEYLQQAAELQPQIDVASEQTEQLTIELRTLEDDAEKLRSRIAATSAEYQKQQELVADRMSETYKKGDLFFFDLLLSSTSFKDLLTRYEYVQRTIEANALYARDLDLMRQSLEEDKESLDRVVADAADKQKEAADVEGALRTMKTAREEAAGNAKQIESQKTALLEDTQANVDALKDLQASLFAEANALLGALASSVQWGSGEFSGTMVWPVGGSGTLTCPIGCTCSIHGGNHSGQDIGTGYANPPALAAAAGRVVQAGPNGGYGNFVSIDHGNGVVTTYAHLQVIFVGAGEMVTAGQPIGNVGSTGFSTGNHLHFEVIVNGQYVNPMKFF